MNVQHHEQNVQNTELLDLAMQSLDDSPVYMEHIGNTMSLCVQNLRTGNDSDGMSAFARGVSDLEQFIQLFDHISNVARVNQDVEIEAFKQDLVSVVRGLEVALTSNDMIALSDGIDGNLLPLLPRWGGVARELSDGVEAQYVA
jgi:hypothetical protein